MANCSRDAVLTPAYVLSPLAEHEEALDSPKGSPSGFGWTLHNLNQSLLAPLCQAKNGSVT